MSHLGIRMKFAVKGSQGPKKEDFQKMKKYPNNKCLKFRPFF